jgi:hypothetical protein
MRLRNAAVVCSTQTVQSLLDAQGISLFMQKSILDSGSLEYAFASQHLVCFASSPFQTQYVLLLAGQVPPVLPV